LFTRRDDVTKKEIFHSGMKRHHEGEQKGKINLTHQYHYEMKEGRKRWRRKKQAQERFILQTNVKNIKNSLMSSSF
jgi:hypothetical protein